MYQQRTRRLRYKRDNNIKTYLTELGYADVDWINLTQERDQRWGLVSGVTNS